jgi:hypothetical protein
MFKVSKIPTWVEKKFPNARKLIEESLVRICVDRYSLILTKNENNDEVCKLFYYWQRMIRDPLSGRHVYPDEFGLEYSNNNHEGIIEFHASHGMVMTYRFYPRMIDVDKMTVSVYTY